MYEKDRSMRQKFLAKHVLNNQIRKIEDNN